MEYDGVDWQRREWVSVYSRRTFRVFLVERTLLWAPRVNEGKELKWPALVSYFIYCNTANEYKNAYLLAWYSDHRNQPSIVS